MPTPDELIANPQWLPYALDVDKDRIDFVRADRSRLTREAFLDERAFGDVAVERASLSDLAPLAPSIDAAPLAFIFHSAFCCSTLLARALDTPNHVLLLKEPKIAMDLANALRVSNRFRSSHDYTMATCNLVFRLLARPLLRSEQVIVKPTNAANNLLPYAAKQGSRILLLYGPLKSFLVSVLKKGEPGRAFVRKQYNIFSLDPGGLGAIQARQAMGFTDLQVAALIWRHQMELFQSYLQPPSGDAASSLDFRVLLRDPRGALRAVARHLALRLDDTAIAERAQGEIFRKNSKFSDKAYNAAQREAEERGIEDLYNDELTLIENWAEAVNLGVDISMPLRPELAV